MAVPTILGEDDPRWPDLSLKGTVKIRLASIRDLPALAWVHAMAFAGGGAVGQVVALVLYVPALIFLLSALGALWTDESRRKSVVVWSQLQYRRSERRQFLLMVPLVILGWVVGSIQAAWVDELFPEASPYVSFAVLILLLMILMMLFRMMRRSRLAARALKPWRQSSGSYWRVSAFAASPSVPLEERMRFIDSVLVEAVPEGAHLTIAAIRPGHVELYRALGFTQLPGTVAFVGRLILQDNAPDSTMINGLPEDDGTSEVTERMGAMSPETGVNSQPGSRGPNGPDSGYGYEVQPFFRKPPMAFREAVRSGFRNYANFTGRATNSEFWWWFAFTQIITHAVILAAYVFLTIGFSILSSVLVAQRQTGVRQPNPDILLRNDALLAGATLLAVGMLLWLVFLIPTLALEARRLHDTGRSGWFALLELVPLGSIVLFAMLALESRPEGMKYEPLLVRPSQPHTPQDLQKEAIG